jgi:hypothetical protein
MLSHLRRPNVHGRSSSYFSNSFGKHFPGKSKLQETAPLSFPAAATLSSAGVLLYSWVHKKNSVVSKIFGNFVPSFRDKHTE